MRSEYQIWMDFRIAQEQVQNLRAVAARMEELADQRMQGALRRVGSNWKGENSEAFQGKGRILQNKITLTASDIRRIADAVEQIARRTRDAELAAIRIAGE